MKVYQLLYMLTIAILKTLLSDWGRNKNTLNLYNHHVDVSIGWYHIYILTLLDITVSAWVDCSSLVKLVLLSRQLNEGRKVNARQREGQVISVSPLKSGFSNQQQISVNRVGILTKPTINEMSFLWIMMLFALENSTYTRAGSELAGLVSINLMFLCIKDVNWVL